MQPIRKPRSPADPKPHPITYTLKFYPYTVDQMQKIERAVAKLKQMPGYVEE